MMRLNKDTNKPFKRGDMREDGFIFRCYLKTKKLKEDGYFQEQWLSPEVFNNYAQRQKSVILRIQKQSPEKANARNRKYHSKKPEKAIARMAKRRAKKLQRTPSWLTDKQLLEITCFYKQAKVLTKQTGITHVVDHIVPLQGDFVSGLHVPWNLQVITAKENGSKSNNFYL